VSSYLCNISSFQITVICVTIITFHPFIYFGYRCRKWCCAAHTQPLAYRMDNGRVSLKSQVHRMDNGKVHAELETVAGRNSSISGNDTEKLPHVQAVVKECLRMHLPSIALRSWWTSGPSPTTRNGLNNFSRRAEINPIVGSWRNDLRLRTVQLGHEWWTTCSPWPSCSQEPTFRLPYAHPPCRGERVIGEDPTDAFSDTVL